MRFVIGSIIALWTVFIVYQSIVPVKAEIIEAPIVVELFTSQSCSSCPPADKILGQLSKTKTSLLLVATLHIGIICTGKTRCRRKNAQIGKEITPERYKNADHTHRKCSSMGRMMLLETDLEKLIVL